MRWALLFALGACYSPSPYTSCQTACAFDRDCPPGLTCADRLCRATDTEVCPPPIDAPVEIDSGIDDDRDDDGIPNSTDLCPDLSSSDNHDHDTDGVGDPCDPCPHLAGPVADLDMDFDGVGDGCDPSMAIDERGAFYGFYDPAEITGWDRLGSWSVANGQLRGANITMGGMFIEIPTLWGLDVAATAEINIQAISTTASLDRYAGIAVRRVNETNYHACHLRELSGVRAQRYRIDVNSTFGDTLATYAGQTLGPHRFELFVDGGNGTCLVDKLPILLTSTPVAPGRVAIDTGLAQIDVDYIFIVKNPN